MIKSQTNSTHLRRNISGSRRTKESTQRALKISNGYYASVYLQEEKDLSKAAATLENTNREELLKKYSKYL